MTSTTGVIAVCVFLLIRFVGIWLLTRLVLDKVQPGEHVRIKARFLFSIETGPPAPTPEDADGKIPEQRPPAVEPPKPTDPDPPS
ncbi:hypothetical protein NQK81_27545 [Amycolatopsis roodepoortensis]|uniref:hypothetical protein n=1 Tax=Amycolatopsis roodepoortensis TaxID=700274 RepID=UPI00214D0406|nr:hypothetical protein [Amycolatopsis roodepoortensis]UUV28535.1 hypothetical protein NQK81_27545 [Amycolatopsis roodepoortensis]